MGCRIPNLRTMNKHAISDLDAAIAVARRCSFRAAALDLGMSTTALSNAVGKLEASLGVRLFNRTTRSVSLTDAGRLFIDQIGPAMSDIHGAMDAVRSQQATPSGTLRINAFAAAARQIFTPLVLKYLSMFPQVHIDLVTEGRLVDIVADGFDLGIRMADLVPSDMIAVPIGPAQRHAVVGSPAYFEKRAKPRLPTDLLEHPCIRVRMPNGAPYRWQFEKMGQQAQIDVMGPVTLDEASLAREAVFSNMGLGFFMELDVLRDIERGRLVRVLEDWTPAFPGLCLYYPGRRNPSAALKAFISLARDMEAATCT